MKNFYKRTMLLVLALCMIMPAFTACGTEKDPSDTSDSVSETDPASTEMIINSENIANVELIRSDRLKNTSIVIDIFVAFRKELEKRFGQKPALGLDFVKPGTEISPDVIEIFVGDTDREESKAFNDKLKALGTPAYGYSLSGNKLSVSGTSEYLIYLALDRVLKECCSTDENGKSIIKIENGTEFIEQADNNYPDPREMVDTGRELAFYTLGKIANIPAKGSYKTVQGGGTDGKYAYVALIDKSTTPETGIIHKYDMSTWKIVATSEPIPSAHTNDITYDSKNHRLVISYCSATDGYRGIVTVNPDTLEFIEYIYAPTVSRGVHYFPETNQYLFAVNYVYYLTNDKFETIKSIHDGYPTLTTQGFYCDGDLIYDPRWDSKAEHQTISVNSMTNKHIGAIPLYDIEGEPESIFRDGNTFVMNCGGSMAFFRLILAYENWWE